jgi:hypothetical protein
MCCCTRCLQGAEKEVIILATTTTNPHSEFCSDAARLNVALTRARRHLLVVGAASVLSQVREGGSTEVWRLALGKCFEFDAQGKCCAHRCVVCFGLTQRRLGVHAAPTVRGRL